MRIEAKEDPRLGNNRVIIQTEEHSLWGAVAVKIKYGEKEYFASVESIRPGKNLLLVDKSIRLYLDIRRDPYVNIESIDKVENAKRATISIPVDWIDKNEKLVRNSVLNKVVAVSQRLQIYTINDSQTVIVSEVVPGPFVTITEDTKINFEPLKNFEIGDMETTYSDIGGLGPALNKIRELVEFPLRLPDAMAYLGIEPPKGILLHGPPRTGKTLLVKALANEVGYKFFTIQGPEIINAFYGESERKLRNIFEEAQKNAPSIILIDEIDSIAPKRDSARGELEVRIVSTLLTLMDGLKKSKGVIIIGTTNRPNAIDPAIRAPGRLEYEIYIGIPDLEGREEILEIHAKRKGMPLQNVDLKDIAKMTHGFVGGDIAFLCREAGQSAFRRYLGECQDDFDFSSLRVTMEDFKNALDIVHPSALREVSVSVPKDVTWEKIGGLREIKSIIEENIIQGIKNPNIFKEMGIRPAKGILLYGPPGTGKTLIAKALANSCNANFISVKGPELRSRWFGESEERIRFIFDTAGKVAPCIIFFDEIDALAPTRGAGDGTNKLTDSLVNQLLTEMDGIVSTEGIFVIGATNRVELIDPALLRPGRFDYQVKIPLPDKEGRKAIFSIHLKKDARCKDIEDSMEDIIKTTDGLSGAEIEDICRLSALKALREVNFEKTNKIRAEHIYSTIEEILEKKKDIYKSDKEDVERYIG